MARTIVARGLHDECRHGCTELALMLVDGRKATDADGGAVGAAMPTGGPERGCSPRSVTIVDLTLG
ncbi:hypothetical protein ROP_pROB01-05030 (plasmid) [Rhodococcus opacus B4]|uniref:Uncharacterized protein n=1 Tax=Rhodococcus opacus (strain B4) TaxID=632772 RepID=C1BCE7_RHOOB|nr:hypothetical protein ROP_pROB01-05030 [Rhodococcus opacus B4]